MTFSFRTTTYAAGLNPLAVVVSDVNGDHKADLIVANYGGSVSVLLGNGAGDFRAATSYSIGPHPRLVAVADINGDGKSDIVVASFGNTVADPTATDGNVAVLLGNGRGGFGTPTVYANSPYPGSLVVMDVNADHKADIVFQDIYRGVNVLLNDGKGGFGAPTAYVVGSGPSSVTMADVNGDGKLDLVVVEVFNNAVGVLLGNGKGSFGAATTYAAGPNPEAVITADINADGKLDLLVRNYSTGVSVLLGRGDGRFGAAKTYAAGPFPQSVSTADINGDDKLDLVVSNGGSNIVSLLLGDGKGGFGVPIPFLAGLNPTGLTTADVNGDGRPDIVVADYQGGVSVLLNTEESGVRWTVQFDDGQGQHSAYYSAIKRTLLAAGKAWSGFLGGSGTIDVVVAFDKLESHASSSTDWYPGSFKNNVLETTGAAYEIEHDLDPNGASSDIRIILNPDYLGAGPGSFWFGWDSPVPAGRRDALSTFEHEIGHALGFYGFWDPVTGDAANDGALSRFDQYVTKADSTFYFNGANAVLLNGGRPVKLESSHLLSLVYHAAKSSDLMSYTRPDGPDGRTGISALDLAMLNDTGVPIANGTSSADVLRCVPGQLTIDGGAGNDRLFGNELANLIRGGDGDDYLIGGGCNDTFDGGAGMDWASYATEATSVTASLDPAKNTDDPQRDLYFSIEGLKGSEFNDTLIGNAAANALDGGAGNDTLTGDTGPDQFVFSTALNKITNVDTITDFNVAADIVQLDHAIFGGLPKGALSANAFHIGRAAADASDRIVYNSATGALFYDSNGSASGGSTQFATIGAGLVLTNADFQIV